MGITDETNREIWIIAGPPGAGKSSLCHRLFPDWIGTSRHIDADDAQGFTHGDDLPKGTVHQVVPVSKRLAVAELANRSFIIETRMVSRKPLATAIKLRRRGWKVHFVYLALPNLGGCWQRVRQRVTRGGDHISDEVMNRAFNASFEYLPQYIETSDKWLILDSSGARAPRIARGRAFQAIPSQRDALQGLMPNFPFRRWTQDMERDAWADPVQWEFVSMTKWEQTVDHLLNVADQMTARNLGNTP
ncbi:hypothetical protein N9L49_02095 [Rhodospirillales bacterium]|nr:hypothetical protein [Rhodospirillales bacterium]